MPALDIHFFRVAKCVRNNFQSDFLPNNRAPFADHMLLNFEHFPTLQQVKISELVRWPAYTGIISIHIQLTNSNRTRAWYLWRSICEYWKVHVWQNNVLKLYRTKRARYQPINAVLNRLPSDCGSTPGWCPTDRNLKPSPSTADIHFDPKNLWKTFHTHWTNLSYHFQHYRHHGHGDRLYTIRPGHCRSVKGRKK